VAKAVDRDRLHTVKMIGSIMASPTATDGCIATLLIVRLAVREEVVVIASLP
jgi:hypothetical protein